MAVTYSLRQADLAFNPNQVRDKNGRWSLVGAVAGKVDALGSRVFSDDDDKSRELDRDEVRSTLHMTSGEISDLYASAGLKPRYHETEEDLAHLFVRTPSDAKREDIKAEMLARQNALNSALATIHEAELASRRDERRRNLEKYDAEMNKSAIGRVLLKVRNRFITDKVFDKIGANIDRVKDYGKDWSLELATSRVASTLVSLSAGLSSVLLSEHAPEAIRQFAENPIAEAGILAAVGLGLSFGLRAVRQSAVKKIKARNAKKRLTLRGSGSHTHFSPDRMPKDS